jgi:hypothetical protein
MKAGMVFTGTGPILVVTACESLNDSKVIHQLDAKGIHKFIAYEVPMERVKERYGQHLSVVMGDLKQSDDLRVIDEEGWRVFYNFPLDVLKNPLCHEDTTELRRAA